MGHELARHWRLQGERYGNAEGGLNGQICDLCGVASLRQRPVCSSCAQPANTLYTFHESEPVREPSVEQEIGEIYKSPVVDRSNGPIREPVPTPVSIIAATESTKSI